MKQVFVGISGEPQLRERNDACVFAAGALGQLDSAFRISSGLPSRTAGIPIARRTNPCR